MAGKLGSIKRVSLIARMKKLGFHGPFSGGKDQFLLRGTTRVVLPNPHAGEIETSLLARVLQQAGISRDD